MITFPANSFTGINPLQPKKKNNLLQSSFSPSSTIPITMAPGQFDPQSAALTRAAAQPAPQSPVSMPKTASVTLPAAKPTQTPIQTPSAPLTPQIDALSRILTGVQSVLQQAQTPTETPAPTIPTPAAPDFSGYDRIASEISTLAGPSDEETQLRTKLSNLLASRDLGITNAESEPTPLQAIIGEQGRIEKRAAIQAGTLQEQLAQAQAKRQAALDVAKTKLGIEQTKRAEIADTAKATREAQQTQFTQGLQTKQQSLAEKKAQQDYELSTKSYALSQSKFDEDKRQFGLKYAQDERKIANDAAIAREKLAADKTPSAQSQSEALSNYQLVNEILGGNVNAITGVPGITAFIPGTQAQYTKNQYEQLKGILSLENRQKLKGSGAISDFESKTLERAASSLGRNLSNEDFKRELTRIKGVFANSAGLPASVRVTDPRTGTMKLGTLDRSSIEDAVRQGYTVEYQ